MNRNVSLALSVTAVMVVTLVALRRVLCFDFVAWDDQVHVYDNPYLNKHTLGEIGHFWIHPYHQLYIPLSYTMFALISNVAHHAPPSGYPTDTGANYDPHIFHAANLILHCINVLLVFLLIRRVIRKDLPAAVGALVFAIHPLQVESVAWISELRGLLGALFALSSLHLYLNAVNTSSARRVYLLHLAMSLIAALAAMLSKPTFAVIGLMIALFGHYAGGRSWKTSCVEALPYAGLGLALALITSHVQALPTGQVVPLWQRPLIICDTLSFYLWKLVVPVKLAIDYGRRPTLVISLWLYSIAWQLPFLVGGLLFRKWIFSSMFRLGLFVALAALLPVSGITPFVYQVFSTVADRYVYFAMLGAAVFAAHAFDLAFSRRTGPAVAVALIYILVLCVLTDRQTRFWKNSNALFQRAVEINPNSAPGNANLGRSYERRGLFRKALKYDLRAATLYPGVADYHEALGQDYYNLNNNGDAVVQFKQALKLNPRSTIAAETLGVIQAQQGNNSAAAETLQNGVRYHPDDAQLWLYLGVALYAEHRWSKAVEAFRHAAALAPNDSSIQNALQQSQHH